MRYLIRRISPLPAVLYGGIMGLLLSIIPGVVLGILVVGAAARLLGWLGNLVFDIPLPLGAGMTVDLIELTKLDAFRESVGRLAAGGGAIVATIALSAILFCGLAGALGGLLGALLFNLIARIAGGIEVSAEAIARETELPPVEDAPLAALTSITPDAGQAEEPPASHFGVWLISAADPRERWPVRQGTTRIGSDAGNDIVLQGLQPFHAELHYEDLRYLVFPTGGPVQVNGDEVVTRHSLRNRAHLKLGEQEFVFQLPITG